MGIKHLFFKSLCKKYENIYHINTVYIYIYIYTQLLTYNYYCGVLVRGWSMTIDCGSFCV